MQHHSIQPTSLGISYGDSAHPSSSQTTTIQDYTHLDPEALNDPSVSKSYEETTEQDEELDEERRIVGQRDEFIRSAAPTPQLPGSHSAFQSIKGGPGVGFLLSGDGGQQQDSEAMSSTAEAQMKEEKEDMSSSLQVSQESLEESAEPMMGEPFSLFSGPLKDHILTSLF